MRTAMTVLVVMWLMIAAISKACSAEVIDAKTLPEVIKANDDYIKSIETVVVAYTKVLNTERDRIFSTGNLEMAKAVEAEKENISKVEPEASTADWKKNGTLKTAQKSFNDGLASKKKAYIDTLNKIVGEFVKKKDLVNAEAVKKFVEELKVEEIKKVFVGTWKYRTDKEYQLQINSDGSVHQNNNEGGQWTIRNGSLFVTMDSSHKVRIYRDGLTYNIDILSPNGSLLVKNLVVEKQ